MTRVPLVLIPLFMLAAENIWLSHQLRVFRDDGHALTRRAIDVGNSANDNAMNALALARQFKGERDACLADAYKRATK